jgi:hypothetical protein
LAVELIEATPLEPKVTLASQELIAFRPNQGPIRSITYAAVSPVAGLVLVLRPTLASPKGIANCAMTSKRIDADWVGHG